MKHLFLVGAATLTLAIAGCGTSNNYLATKSQTVEYYRIFDIKTGANRMAVAKAASNGIGRNATNAQEATPIPSSGEIPALPGRFKIFNPFAGSNFAALAGGE